MAVSAMPKQNVIPSPMITRLFRMMCESSADKLGLDELPTTNVALSSLTLDGSNVDKSCAKHSEGLAVAVTRASKSSVYLTIGSPPFPFQAPRLNNFKSLEVIAVLGLL